MTEIEHVETLNPIGVRKVKQRMDAFIKAVEENKDKKWCVCSHDNPDPDSMASCLMMLRILQFLGIEHVEMVYRGLISNPQNRAMQNVLDIPMKKWTTQMKTDVDENPGNYVFVYVDCLSNQQKNMTMQFDPIIAVDHHKSTLAFKGADTLVIYEEIGSCSTLMLDLALSLPPKISGEEDIEDVCFDPNGENTKELATALAIGIKSDTIDFRHEGTTEYDYKAYKLLGRFLSDDKFNKIINYQLPPYIFELEQIAWENKNENYTPDFVTYVGYIDESKSDCISYLADKYMRHSGVQTVLVYGVVGNSVRGSIRTSDSSLDVQSMCDQIFGEGNGGVKRGGIGGAKVSFNLFDMNSLEEKHKKAFSELVRAQIETRFQEVVKR